MFEVYILIFRMWASPRESADDVTKMRQRLLKRKVCCTLKLCTDDCIKHL